jgi:hypothetical protein
MYLGKDRARWIPGLVRAGLPLLELQLFDLYDLGAEFLRWEIATAAAGWMMKINPFDQPNIQESKDNTKRLLAECSASGCLPESDALPVSAGTEFSQRLLRHLRSCRASDYVALTAYVKRTPLRDKLLQQLRDAIGQRYNLATTAGYGPRFLHSTGQLHKGGANNAVILQFICQDHEDMPVPGEAYTFGILKAAQALGDYQSLVLKNRRVLRIQLGMNVEAGFKAVLAAIPLKTKRR